MKKNARRTNFFRKHGLRLAGCVAIFILAGILLRKKSRDRAHGFISCARLHTADVSPDFSFRAGAGSRRRKRPLFFLRYMWRGRRVITPWNFPRSVQHSSRTLFSFSSSSPFLFFRSLLLRDPPQGETSTSALSSSSLDRACWDASGIASRQDSREFIVNVFQASWSIPRKRKEEERGNGRDQREKESPLPVSARQYDHDR